MEVASSDTGKGKTFPLSLQQELNFKIIRLDQGTAPRHRDLADAAGCLRTPPEGKHRDDARRQLSAGGGARLRLVKNAACEAQ